MMRRIVIGCFVLAVAALLAYLMRPQPAAFDMGRPERRTVQEYIAEEAKTRLAREYTLDMPVAGTLERIALEVGDIVEAGAVAAEIERFPLEQQVRAAEAALAQVRAQNAGVDVAKPKPEDLGAAALRAQEAADAMAGAQRQRNVAHIDLENARREFGRVEQLHDDGIASASDLDAARRVLQSSEQLAQQARLAEAASQKAARVAELSSQRLAGSIDDNEYQRAALEAEAQRLEAELDIYRRDLEKARILAPVAGPVLEKYVTDRRVLPPGTPLLKIGDLSSIEIECDVLSEDAGRLQPGQPVELAGKALGDGPAAGRVKRVYPSAFMKISSLGIEQQRVKVLIEFDNGPLQLRAGTRLDVRIITAARDGALAVQERSTFRRDGAWYVFTVRRGRAMLTPVRIGLKNDAWAEIADGLDENATIILDPSNELDEGARVVPRE